MLHYFTQSHLHCLTLLLCSAILTHYINVFTYYLHNNIQRNNSFANGIRTADGGTHLDSLKAVITRTINSLGKKSGKIKDTAEGNSYAKGLLLSYTSK
jgi:DNA gyrase/topoisomerase IV subunit B